jgi:hypothetical protein
MGKILTRKITPNNLKFNLNRKQLEIVDEFNHLGVLLTKNATKKNRVPLASNDISINGKSAILAIPATKKPVVIIDRSMGQENIDFDRFAIIPQPEGQTVDRKIDKKTNSALFRKNSW